MPSGAPFLALSASPRVWAAIVSTLRHFAKKKKIRRKAPLAPGGRRDAEDNRPTARLFR